MYYDRGQSGHEYYSPSHSQELMPMLSSYSFFPATIPIWKGLHTCASGKIKEH